MATARVVRRLPIDRWFYIGMAICAIIVSVLGFAPFFVNTAASCASLRGTHKSNEENIQ